jgi:diadenosine tetraphosphate (Ap4A) HIT family hydrolase
MTHTDDFLLDPRLAAESAFVADWPLARVMLRNDRRYAWLVLVPRRASLVELHDLSAVDRPLLADEVARASSGLKRETGAAKINVGALGNIVSQLHIHVVARNPGDPAWPGPVWGAGAAEPYAAARLAERVAALRTCL